MRFKNSTSVINGKLEALVSLTTIYSSICLNEKRKTMSEENILPEKKNEVLKPQHNSTITYDTVDAR